MARFISLLRFTDRGVRTTSRSTGRAQAFTRAATKAGVTVEGQYWSTGNFDGVLILSAKEPAAVLQVLARLEAMGNVRAVTYPLFSDREFDAIAGAP